MSRSVQRSQTEHKKDVTNWKIFQRALELVLILCTPGGSQRAIFPGMRHAACATRRSYSCNSEKELGKELDVIGHVHEEYWVLLLL